MLNAVIGKMTFEKGQISEKAANIADASQLVAATSEEITASDIQHLKELSGNLESSISKFYI